MSRETKGRGGKGVTIISDLPLDETGLTEVATKLKARLGTGGTVKDGRIEIQGDHRHRVVSELEGMGYRVKRAGGGLMDKTTRWCHLIAWFFGGAFLTNAVPHLVSGVSGDPLQTPFASPPGVGLSSSTVNVLWGMFNLVAGYVLVVRVGQFDLRQTRHVVVLGLGILAMALLLACQLGKLHGGNL